MGCAGLLVGVVQGVLWWVRDLWRCIEGGWILAVKRGLPFGGNGVFCQRAY